MQERAKSDGVLFLKALDESDADVHNINEIGKSMAAFRPKLNEISQAEFGNKKLRVDKEEIVYTRLISPYENMQNYRHHKDSYIHDPNNELDGMELRKLSMVVFLNDELDENEPTGMLRLYTKGREVTEGVVDISPRLGRAVLFKSEEMLHQVMSSQGWENCALTFYFT